VWLLALGLNGYSDEIVEPKSGNEGGVYHCSRSGIVYADRGGTAVSHEEFIAQNRELVRITQPRNEVSVNQLSRIGIEFRDRALGDIGHEKFVAKERDSVGGLRGQRVNEFSRVSSPFRSSRCICRPYRRIRSPRIGYRPTTRVHWARSAP
jgi:hypothetical protein